MQSNTLLGNKNIFIFLLILIVSLGFTLIISNLEYKLSTVIVLVIIGSPILFLSISNSKWGITVLIIYSYFLFLISRLLPFPFPGGTIVDFLAAIILFGIIIKPRNSLKITKKKLDNPITYMLLVYSAYILMEIFNPNSFTVTSSVIIFRGVLATLVIFFLFAHVINSLKRLNAFTNTWLFLSLLAGLYGIYQEIFGFADFEWTFIHSVDGMYKRLYIWGHLRKFSFLSDVAAFGLLMAFSVVFASIMLFKRHAKIYTRLYLFIIIVVCGAAMVFSGTRTAYAIIPFGLFLYFLLNINNIKILIAAISIFVVFIIILFGPFYSGPFKRIKSAFKSSDDPSMNVRDVNRKSIQPYIWSHPFGGGLFTTGIAGKKYAPSHRLAGFPPDSGYLKAALETGWIGLMLILVLYGIITSYGAQVFLNSHNSNLKIMAAAYTCSFFAISIGNLTQDAMNQKPIGIIIVAIYSILPTLKFLNHETISNDV